MLLPEVAWPSYEKTLANAQTMGAGRLVFLDGEDAPEKTLASVLKIMGVH